MTATTAPSSTLAPTVSRPESFYKLAIGVGICIFLAAALQFTARFQFVYMGISVGGISILFWYALSRIDAKARFSGTNAAEVIIVIGIASVVLGLLASLYRILLIATTVENLELPLFVDAVYPFVEGLAAAGFAPILAVILRYKESAAAVAAGDALDTTAVAEQLHLLGERLKNVVDDAAALSGTLKVVTDDLRTAGKEAIGSLKGLGSAATLEAGRAADAFNSVAGAATALETTFVKTRTHLEGSVTAVNEFKKSLGEGTKLLDGLSRIIASIDRFVDRMRTAA